MVSGQYRDQYGAGELLQQSPKDCGSSYGPNCMPVVRVIPFPETAGIIGTLGSKVKVGGLLCWPKTSSVGQVSHLPPAKVPQTWPRRDKWRGLRS